MYVCKFNFRLNIQSKINFLNTLIFKNELKYQFHTKQGNAYFQVIKNIIKRRTDVHTK